MSLNDVPTSEVCIDAMLVLLMVVNWKVYRQVGL